MLPIGTRMKIGNIELEVSQIGKECHTKIPVMKIFFLTIIFL